MRKPLRALTSVATLSVLALGLLSGCGDSNDDPDGETSAESQGEESTESTDGDEGDTHGSDGHGEDGHDHEHSPGDIGLTPEALAAVATEHLDEQPTNAVVSTESEQGVGARLNFGDDSFSAHMLNLTVAPPETDQNDCSQQGDNSDGCEEIDVDGQKVYVSWEEEAPEEDPGIIVVWTQREDEFIGAYYAGDEINGDPRKQDLSVDVDQIVDIVTDERLVLDASDEVIALGEDLDLEWVED